MSKPEYTNEHLGASIKQTPLTGQTINRPFSDVFLLARYDQYVFRQFHSAALDVTTYVNETLVTF